MSTQPCWMHIHLLFVLLTRRSSGGRGDMTILHSAAACGNAVCMELVLQNNAPYEVADACGRTPLHYCILYDAIQVGSHMHTHRQTDTQTQMDGFRLMLHHRYP